MIESKGQTISNYPRGLPEEEDITHSGILWEKKLEGKENHKLNNYFEES